MLRRSLKLGKVKKKNIPTSEHLKEMFSKKQKEENWKPTKARRALIKEATKWLFSIVKQYMIIVIDIRGGGGSIMRLLQ